MTERPAPSATASTRTPATPNAPAGPFWDELEAAKGDGAARRALDEKAARFGYAPANQLRTAIRDAILDLVPAKSADKGADKSTDKAKGSVKKPGRK